MKCNYCGADNKEGSKFCASCGAEIKETKKATKEAKVVEEKVEEKPAVKETVKPNTTNQVKDGKSTASLVLGIISFIVWCLTLPLSIVGLILGIASKERSGKRTAGIILNAIALGLSLIAVLATFWFGTVITAAVEEFERSGNIEKFFETIEEEMEKEYEKEYEKPEVVKPVEDDTKVVGNDHYGYVKVPKNWIEFHDVNNNTVYQYTDIGEKGYIITLQTYDEDISPYTAANNIKNSVVSEGNTATVSYTKISTYYGYVVNAKYTDGTYLDAYLFKANGKLHYVSIEGPNKYNDNFKIPETFSLEK